MRKTEETVLISVIVPVYMIERYIGICIESIINQTYYNLEIILVDDGSRDRCSQICDLYAKKDRRIKVIHKKNGGLVSARKAGLMAASGKYIGYVDGDDWIEPGYYEAMHCAMEAADADIVCAGQSRDLFDQSECFYNSYPAGIYEGKRLKALYRSMISQDVFFHPGITTYVWNKLFKKELLYFSQMNVDERITIGEDAAVTYPALLNCKRVCVMENVSYHYRQREDSMLKQSSSFEDDARKLKYLYEYMRSWTKLAENRRGQKDLELSSQVMELVLSICIIRSGGRVQKEDGYLPYSAFDEAYLGKKIVVYSAGTFGQQLVNRLKENSLCDIVLWVDDDYWEYRRCCLDVDPVESVINCEFDYILVATVNGNVAKNINVRLLDLGIEGSKILTIKEPDNKEEVLKRFLA